VAGAGLQVAAGMEYVLEPVIASDAAWLNGHWLGALLLALAGAWSSRLFDGSRNRGGEQASALPAAANAFLAWALAWWLWAGFDEIQSHIADSYTLAAGVLFVASTVVLGLFGATLLDWRRLAAIGLCAWPLAVLLFLVGYATAVHPAANLGWIAWPVLCATLFVFLRLRETQFPSLTGASHAIAFWLAAALVVSEVHWQVARVATADWAAAAVFALAAAVVLITLYARDKGTWPVGVHARIYVKACCAGVVAALALGVVAANALLAGNPAPLPYLPLANPLELASAVAFYTMVRWLAALEEHESLDPASVHQRAGFVAAYGLFLLTMAVARAVHHFADVPFDAVNLARSTVLQASLSLVWGAAALTTMVLGARRVERGVWLAGAMLMTVVVVKLLLVDLGNTGTLARIVSFLGVGVLLMIVGYFAPVPPRAEAREQAA
jgi:uncharacterized membrane protein